VSVRYVRHLVSEWCDEFDPDLQDDMELAVTEAATNAVLHAYPGEADGQFELRIRTAPGEVLVEVRDFGVGRDGPTSRSGLGIGLGVIEAVTAAVSVEDCTPGTLLRMRFKRRGQARPHRTFRVEGVVRKVRCCRGG
jgi:serine/threonine-protein kinase RsbW